MDFFEEEKRRLNPLYGIGLFFIIMVLFIFVFAPLQFRFGMVGLLLTELGLLFVTLLAVRLTKQSFREVFPIRRPRFGQIVGTILIWVGCFLFVMLVTLASMMIFPEGFLDISSNMSSMFSSVPAFFSFLIVAVSPAICEEAMHRGFIMHTFRGITRDWVVVLCIGLIFGLFHLDPYRFLPTALLGMGLAYVMRKSNNMLLPALFHFINNSISFLASLSNTGPVSEEAERAAAELLMKEFGIQEGIKIILDKHIPPCCFSVLDPIFLSAVLRPFFFSPEATFYASPPGALKSIRISVWYLRL